MDPVNISGLAQDYIFSTVDVLEIMMSCCVKPSTLVIGRAWHLRSITKVRFFWNLACSLKMSAKTTDMANSKDHVLNVGNLSSWYDQSLGEANNLNSIYYNVHHTNYI